MQTGHSDSLKNSPVANIVTLKCHFKTQGLIKLREGRGLEGIPVAVMWFPIVQSMIHNINIIVSQSIGTWYSISKLPEGTIFLKIKPITGTGR